MLILAGVSLNAIVGDNGIITNAQKANVQSGMAALEEFLQEKYVENFDNIDDDNESKVIQLQNIYPEYFYIPSMEGIGGLRYIVNSDGKALYLIKKDELPQNIKQQLIGGDAGNKTYKDYASLNDVYGVTSDLKVYYCNSGIDSIQGATMANLDIDNPNRIIISKDDSIVSSLIDYDDNEDGEINSIEIRKITNLTLDSSMNINSLDSLYKYVSLKNLILDGLDIENLNGIENCPNLESVLFKSTHSNNYLSLCKLTQLNKLYFYNIDDNELNIICDANKGIANGKFSNLKYFGVFGDLRILTVWNYSWSHQNWWGGKSSKTITNIEVLDNLSIETKKAVKYLLLNNNNINSLKGIENFVNVYELRLESNNLTNLDGLETLNPVYLFLANNKIGSNENYDSSKSLDSQYSENDGLKAIENKKSIYYLVLSSNPLKFLKYCSNLSGCRYFYGWNIINIADANTLKNVKYNCGSNFFLDSKYELDFLDSSLTRSVVLSSRDVSLSNLESIKSCTNIYRLKLNDINFIDNEGNSLNSSVVNSNIENCLNNLVNMQYLDLRNNEEISTINFVKKMPNLKQILLTGTKVSDLSLLDNCTKINNIHINYSNSSSTLTPNTIKRCVNRNWRDWVNWSSGTDGSFESGGGITLGSESCLNSINWPTDLEYFNNMNQKCFGTIDLSKCENITQVNVHSASGIKVNAEKLNFVMAWSDNIEFIGNGGDIGIYLDNYTGDTSFLGKNYTCFNTIYFSNLRANLTWLSSADQSFKNAVTSLRGGFYYLNLNDLSDYNNMEELSITVNRDSSIKVGDISNLIKLKKIYFYNFKNLNLSFIPLENLEALVLYNCGVSSISELSKCKNLISLNLSNNPIYDLSYDSNGDSVSSVSILVNLNKLYKLKNLNLGGTYITDFDELNNCEWDSKGGF